MLASLYRGKKHVRKLIISLAVLVLVFSPMLSLMPYGNNVAYAMSGAGTEIDPYIIMTLNDLQDMNKDPTAYYKLGANIDASATSGWNEEQGFEPIGGTNAFRQRYAGQEVTSLVTLPTQRDMFYAHGYYWFVVDGKVYSSDNGRYPYWENAGTLGNPDQYCHDSLTYNSTTDRAYYAYIESNKLYLSVFTPEDDGTITINNSAVLMNESGVHYYSSPAVAAESSGTVYISYTRVFAENQVWVDLVCAEPDGEGGYDVYSRDIANWAGEHYAVTSVVDLPLANTWGILYFYQVDADLYSTWVVNNGDGNLTAWAAHYISDSLVPPVLNNDEYDYVESASFSVTSDKTNGAMLVYLKDDGEAIYSYYTQGLDDWYMEDWTIAYGLESDECPVISFVSLSPFNMYVIFYHDGQLYEIPYINGSWKTARPFDDNAEDSPYHQVNCAPFSDEYDAVPISLFLGEASHVPQVSLLAGLRGGFDGNGKTISNLFIDRAGTKGSSIGLFGSIGLNVEVENFTLTFPEMHASMELYSSLGAIAGSVFYSSSIHNVTIVNGYIGDAYLTGGCLGAVGSYWHTDDTMSIQLDSLTYSGDVISYVEDAISSIGGIVGEAYADGEGSVDIEDCYFSGNIAGYYNLGGIAGSADGTTITSSDSTGTIQIEGESAGGIVGNAAGTEIIQCSSSVDISGNPEEEVSYCGGLMGMGIYSTISESYATGNIACYSYAGGLVGQFGTSGDTITESFSTGSVSVDYAPAGGLVGYLADGISDCYSMSDVFADDATGGLGGLVGYLNTFGGLGIIENSYAMGAVTYNSGDEHGGLVGARLSETGVYASFWDTETSGEATSEGGTGLPTESMTNGLFFAVAGWSGNIWCQSDGFNDDYPYLKNVTPGAILPCDLSGSYPTSIFVIVVTDDATGVTFGNATLQGRITALGINTVSSVGYDWGLTPAYGDTWVTSADSPYAVGAIEPHFIGDLIPDTVYHFRAKAYGNTTGWAYGDDNTFFTSDIEAKAYIDITVTGNCTDDYDYVSLFTTDILHTALIDAGYINEDATNTQLAVYMGAVIPYLPVSDRLAFMLTNLATNEVRTLRYYLGTTELQDDFFITVGFGGNITTTDQDALEPGNTWQIDVAGYFDMSTGDPSPSGKYIVYKQDAMSLYIGGAGNLTATIGNDAAPTKTISTVGIGSGIHTLRVASDATDFNLYVDGALVASTLTASVGNNTNDWYFMGNNSMGAMEYLKMSVLGGEVLWYQPTAYISGSTVIDRDGTEDGTINWGTNPTCITVTVGGILSNSIMPETGDTMWHAPPIDISGWFGGCGDVSSQPFYDTFNEKATELGMPVCSLYLALMLGTCAAIGLGVLVFTGSMMISILAVAMAMLAAANTSVVPVWIMFVFALAAISILYLSRQT